MSASKHIYKIELTAVCEPEQAALEAIERLRRDGKRAEMIHRGMALALSVEGTIYQLSVVSAAGSGIGVPCVLLRE